MKVYIVLGTDGYNETIVDKVFSTERLAIKYVIEKIFGDNSFYKKMSAEEINKEARRFVEEHETQTRPNWTEKIDMR